MATIHEIPIACNKKKEVSKMYSVIREVSYLNKLNKCNYD
jgi:hypothetical protein